MADPLTPPPDDVRGTSPLLVPPSRATGRPVWWLVGALAGALLLGLALSRRPAPPPAERRSEDMTAGTDAIALREGAPQWQFLTLTTVGEAGSHWTDPVPARISIDESRSARIGVPVDGRVVRVLVELGDQVRDGQPLFVVASPGVDELRAARAQAEVELDAARAAASRVEGAVAARALPAKDAEAARQRVRAADLALQLADTKLGSIRATTSGRDLVVAAPREGVVVDKTVVVNQQVGPDGPPLMVVADLSSVWVVADVFESEAFDLKPGVAAQVISPSLPGVTLEGTVLMVPAVGDPERHTLPVRIRLSNADRRLRPNVYARVRFNVQHASASLEIPATAIVSDGERQFVYVQTAPGHFTRREVVAGSAHEGRLPILRGLAAGETVVADGAILLDNQIAISQ